MEDIIKADVLAVAPNLSTLTDQYWMDLLTWVNTFDFSSLDDDQTVRMARIFLAAHTGTLVKKAPVGAVGPVTSEAAGGVRRSYGFYSAAFTSSLAATMYGQTLQTILSMSGAHGPFVV